MIEAEVGSQAGLRARLGCHVEPCRADTRFPHKPENNGWMGGWQVTGEWVA